MRRTIWRACGIALIGGLGFGAAYTMAGSATAAVPTTSVTLPTVSVPTLPTLPITTTVTVPPITTTTVTLPPPPPVLPPPPPLPPPPASVPSLPTPTLPAVGTPAPTPSASAPSSPAAPRTAAPPGSTARPSTTVAGSDTGSDTAPFVDAPTQPGASAPSPATTSAPGFRVDAASVGLARFDVSRKRFANRGEKRGAAVLRFRLSRAARLVLLVRGPGPSCATAGRIALRGRAGLNRFRFNGRIAGRPLAPGTYLLTLQQRGRTTELARTLVTIVAPGAPVTARQVPQCTGASGARGPGFTGSLEGDTGVAARASVKTDPVAPTTRDAVLDEDTAAFRLLPPLHLFEEPDDLPAVLGLAVLALLVVSLVGILVEVVRHVRSSHA